MNSRTMSRFPHHEETEGPSRFRYGHTAPAFYRSRWEENPDREDRSETGLTRIHSTRPPSSEDDESDESDESFELPDFVPKLDDFASEVWPRTNPTREDSPELPDPPEYRPRVANSIPFHHSINILDEKGSIPCASDISAGLDGWLLGLDCSPVNVAHSLGNFESWASKYHLGHKPASGASSYAMVMQALRELYQDSDVPIDIWFRMPTSLQRRWIFAVGMSKIAAEEGLTEWTLDDRCLLQKFAEVQEQRLHTTMSPPFIRARRDHCYYACCTDEGSSSEDEDIEECGDIAFYDQGSSSDEMEQDDSPLFKEEHVDEDVIPESDSEGEEEDELVQYLFQYDNGTV